MAFDARRSALIREKLALARQLIRLLDETRHTNMPVTNEALVQGAIAVLSEGRSSLLILVGQAYGLSATDNSASLSALSQQLGEHNGEIQFIQTLAQDPESWWSRLERLIVAQREPRMEKKAGEQTELIAVAAAQEPDRSPEAILALIEAFGAHLEEFTERHHEW